MKIPRLQHLRRNLSQKHFCRKFELNALPCNFPSESDAVRPKKAIPDAEFNTGGIQMDKKGIYDHDDENAKDDDDV